MTTIPTTAMGNQRGDQGEAERPDMHPIQRTVGAQHWGAPGQVLVSPCPSCRSGDVALPNLPFPVPRASVAVLRDPLSATCPVCRAAPQVFCRRPDGAITSWVHRGRERRAEARATASNSEDGALR